MTEQQYIDATNLAKVKIALSILNDVLFDDETFINNTKKGAQSNLSRIVFQLEGEIDLD